MNRNDLEKELINLTKLGFIQDTQLENITNNYLNAGDKTSSSKTLLVFSLLGITFVGSGIIFLFSYNWSMFSIPLKAFFSVIPLVLTQVVLFYKVRTKASVLWIELLCIAVGVALISGIDLIFNTFQLNYPIALVMATVVLMLAPLVYVLNSYYLAIAIFSITMITWLSDNFNVALLSLSVLVPYYYVRRKRGESSSILAILCAMFICFIPFSLEEFIRSYNFIYVSLCIVFCFAFANVDSKVRYISKIVVYAYLFFLVISGDVLLLSSYSLDGIIIVAMSFVAVFYGIVYVKKKYNGLEKIDFFAIVSILVSFIVGMIIFSFTENVVIETIFSYVLKILLISLSVVKIIQAIKTSNMNSVTRYLLVLSVYIYFEFINISDNVLLRGIFLLIMGSIFLGVNYKLSKKVKNER